MQNALLLPTLAERLHRVRSDLAMGMPCVLTQGPARALMVPLETIAAARFDALRAALGAPELVISHLRAQAVMTPAAAANLVPGPIRIRPPEGADLAWYRRVSDPAAAPEAGPIGPLHVLRAGETAMPMAGLQLMKRAQLVPAFALFALPRDGGAAAEIAALPVTTLEAQDALHALAEHPGLTPASAARLPLEAHEASRLHVYREPDGTREHYAIQIGTPDPAQPVLVRLHSACFTGDVLGSLKCDCGPQLRAALAQMGAAGAGVLLYLNQEGRGIGLANKMRVYALQSAGYDTVEANHRLGYADEERDFRIAAELLGQLGIGRVRLLTNNPAKVATLTQNGIDVVERLPLKVGRTVQNHEYLAVKARKSGHLL